MDVLLTTVTSYQDAKGTTDKNLIAIDVNPQNRADALATLGHETSHARGGTSELLADMSGYATQLLGDAAIGSHDQNYLNAIKFEMGTGKDTATQAANQVLLGNDNQVLLDAYNDHQLEFYLKGLDDYTKNPLVKVSHGAYNAKDVPPMPDYVSVASNSKLKIFNGNIALNLHNGEFFLGGAVVLPGDGKFTPIVTKNGFSLLLGYIDRDDSDRGKLTNDFLGGMGGQGTICAYGLCGGVNVSSDKTVATEVGIGSAGIGISAGSSSSISNLNK